MKKIWLLPAAVLLLTASLSPAGTFKDGPFAGYVFGGDTEDADLALGWQAAYEYNRYASIAFDGSWHEDRTSEGLDFDVWSFALMGRVGFVPHPSTRVYGGVGVGYYALHADNEQVRIKANEEFPGQIRFAEVRFDKDFGFPLAAGVEVMLTRHWELFTEFRYVFFDTDMQFKASGSDDDFGTRAKESFPYDYGMLRLGLNYRF